MQVEQDKHRGVDPYEFQSLKKSLSRLGFESYYFSETDSTMNRITEHAYLQENDPVVVIADHQTQGVGREGRVWRDTPGCSIMFSTLFHIEDSTSATFADLVALETCHALRQVTENDEIRIKYPNDLVADDKKLGGILVKNMYDEDHQYKGTNVGIGINAHYTKDALETFPTDYPATSLDVISGSVVRRQDVLIEILDATRYLGPEAEAAATNVHLRESYDEKWQQASSLLGRQIALIRGDEPLYEGEVIETRMGQGINLQTAHEQRWVSLFDSDMKVRMKS